MRELDLGLPDGPLPWWEVRAEHPGGDAPWPPPRYPPDVLAAHSAVLTILCVQAASASAAVARAEELLPGERGTAWGVREVTAGVLLPGT